MATQAIIELRDICRTFVTGGGVEVQALRGVNLTIHSGEFVAIVGQSGSGKTTLMNILGCLDRPSSGQYRFAGQDIERYGADELAWLRREAFGFVFQSYNLLPHATAAENVEVPAIYAGVSAADRIERAEHLLSSLGLQQRLDHRPSQLSGGQQQRVSIARAMMNGGHVILADEPTGALDTQSGIEVMALLDELARKGHTVILITHDPEVAGHADRVIEFRDGTIVSDRINRTPVPKADRPADTVDPIAGLFARREHAHALAGLGESIRMALRSLRSNIFRTILTLLGIVIGVSSVVAMLAIGEGAQQQIANLMNTMGTNVLTVEPARVPGSRRNLPSTLTLEDAAGLQSDVPGVSAALPQLQGNFTVRYGANDERTMVMATTEAMPDVDSWALSRGVFFTDQDSEDHIAVAVIGSDLVTALFPVGADPLGEYLLIRNMPFQVIGVMVPRGSAGFRDPDEMVYIPYKTGAVRLFGNDRADEVRVLVEDVDRIDDTALLIQNYLTARHGTGDIEVEQNTAMLESASESQRTFTLLLGSVAAISLLVGGIGVMNIMLVSVTERTREIGIRMATGARQGDILSQFLAEAIVVSCLGGLVGLALGISIGLLLSSFGIPVHFSPTPMILAVSCAVSTGLVFGFAPARKAARMDPVTALATD